MIRKQVQQIQKSVGKTNNVHGFTLLETIIAIGIIATAVIAIMTMSLQLFKASETFSSQFIASNMAREAIEVVRQVRDTNWLEYDTDSTTAWNDGLYNGTDYTAVISVFDPFGSANLDFTPDSLTDTCTGSSTTYNCGSVWYDSITQRYFQTGSTSFPVPLARFTETEYKRIVEILPLCRHNINADDETVPGTTCSGAYSQVGIAVTATVEYTTSSGQQTYVLEEHMYDWKF